MNDKNLKQDIKVIIKQFATLKDSLSSSAIHLFQTLGYNTDRRSPLTNPTYQEFQSSYITSNPNSEKFSEERAQTKDWQYIDLLFQITSEELTPLLPGFSTQKIDNTIIESYLFFVLELEKDEYSRSQLSQITREINKLFAMPVMILFKHGASLTLSIINRRLHKKDQSKDVLEKVTLIKDISTQSPHRAHIEILFDLSLPEIIRKYKVSNFVELHQAWQKTLDTKELNKNFYKELSNWYFWAINQVHFPDDMEKNEEIRNATSLIRLLTRIIFIWFIKEKGLIGEKLFSPDYLKDILKDFDPNSSSSSFYQAILQNLFFGTLNQKISERKFAQNGCQSVNKKEYGVKTLYRYDEQFAISKEQVQEIFKPTPFLNGGLFDCLDKEDEMHKVQYADGFSRNPNKRAQVPDFLFFGSEVEVELNPIYDTSKKKYTSKGLITILDSYKFTITENSPIEEEIALDPELLGKVFENLLASYNPETQTTARKSTGSFYTPREIVHYMVDESLLAYFKQKLEDSDIKDSEEKLRSLIGYNEDPNPFNAHESQILIQAVDSCKILDPACGSGAFPMGILQKLVHILHKLDPNNQLWKEKQLQKARQIDDVSIREKLILDIESAFKNNELDYGRKLYLIENCIYGVDIQPIAIQIAKLRFFISLIIDQKKQSKEENYGIRALPNLETKFVCANTLIGLDKPEGFFRDPAIEAKEQELKTVRHDYFNSKTREQKLAYQKKDKALREQISSLLIHDGWNDVSAHQVAGWDPYDQNASSPFFDPEWMFGLRDGFDIVIGNPPYMRVQALQQTQSEFMQFYRDNFKSAKGSFDIYALFVERGIKLANNIGQLVFILPHKFFQATFGSELRKILTKQKALRQIVRFGAEQVFNEATTYTCLLFLSNKPQNIFCICEVKSLSNAILNSVQNNLEHTDYAKGTLEAPKNENWDFSIGENNKVMQRLLQHKTTFGDITRKIFQGIATSSDKIYVLKVVEDLGDKIRCYSNHLNEEIEIEKELTRSFLMGKDVRCYEKPVPKNVVIFPYWINEGKAFLMTQKEIETNFPLGWNYLLRNKQALGERERGRMHGEQFYAYIYPKNLIEFDAVKIMTPDICNKPEMTIDDSALLYHTTTIYSFVFNEKALYSPKFYLGLLNSKVIWYFLSQTGTVLRGGYLRFKTEYLKPFPIAKANDKQQKAIEILVDCILFLKEFDGNSNAISMFESTINGIVYGLYFEEETKAHSFDISQFVTEMMPSFKPEMKESEKLQICEKAYHDLVNPSNPLFMALERQKTIKEVRIIEGLDKE